MTRTLKVGLALLISLTVLTLCFLAVISFLFLPASEHESQYFPKVVGQLNDQNGKPVSGTYILVAWGGEEIQGFWWLPVEEEHFRQTYREAYVRTDASGRFTINPWTKQGPRLTGVKDWSGNMGVCVVSPGYRPAVFSSNPPMFVSGYKDGFVGTLKASKKQPPMAAKMQIRIEPLSSDYEAVQSMTMIKNINSLGAISNTPTSPETQALRDSVNYEYFRQILRLYPNGPESPAIVDLLKSKSFSKSPLIKLCRKVIKASKDSAEISVAKHWLTKLTDFENMN